MNINIRCINYKSDFRLGTKECPRCRTRFTRANRKDKVAVKTMSGSRVVRLVGNLALAHRVESSLKGKVAKRKILGVTRTPLLSDIWEKYYTWAMENHKSWRHYVGRWKWHVAPHVKGKKMDQVSPSDIEQILNGMKKYSTGIVSH